MGHILRKSFPFIILLIVLISAENTQGQFLHCQSRTTFFCGSDNNIFESFGNQTNDFMGRFLIHWTGKGTLNPFHDLIIRYSGGLEGYSQHGVENRTIHDLSFKYVYHSQKKPIIGMNSQARIKKFFSDNRGYLFLKWSPFVGYRFGKIVYGSFLFSLSRFNNFNISFFNYRVNQGGLSFTFYPNHSVVVDLKWTVDSFRFHREAYGYHSDDSTGIYWISKEKDQHDVLRDLSMTFEIYSGFLTRLSVGYQDNRSNSYGYSFFCPRVQLLVVKEIIGSWILSGYGSLQQKKYSDCLDSTLQILPDTETEENSYIIFDLSKEFSRKWGITFRTGWYINESPFRNRYYKKSLFSFGLSHRF